MPANVAWGPGSGAGSCWKIEPLTSCPLLVVHLLVPSLVDRQQVVSVGTLRKMPAMNSARVFVWTRPLTFS